MADPFTMATIGMMASAGSGIIDAVGALQEGQAQSAMYQYQASVARVNAQIAKQNADYALSTGEQRAMMQGLKSRAAIGQAIARMGASGIAVGTGSSEDVLKSANEMARIDQGTIRNTFAREAYGYNVTASMQTAQAGMYDASAENALQAGNIKAISSILGGVSSVASKWSSGTSSGIYS